jgi:hypothetical protein
MPGGNNGRPSMAAASLRTLAGAVTVTGAGGFPLAPTPRFSLIVTALAAAGIFSRAERFASALPLTVAAGRAAMVPDVPALGVPALGVPALGVPALGFPALGVPAADWLADAQPAITVSAAQPRATVAHLDVLMGIGRSDPCGGSVADWG